jgi:rubrerythrin
MSKKTRAEKKAEEARIIAEMEAAVREQRETEQAEDREKQTPSIRKSNNSGLFLDVTPEQIHCRRCKTLMENGVCPICGFKVYVPMSKEKQNKIKVIATAVAMAVFVVIFVIMQFVK